MPDLRPLPDDLFAAIAWADDAVSNVDLAQALGLPRERVWATRRRIKRAGHWSCPLVWRTCPECGDPIASGPKPHARIMHPACAKLRAAQSTEAYAVKWRAKNPERYRAIREKVKARQRAEWRARPPEERAAHLATFAADNQRDYARTLPHAHQSGRRWSAAEDAMLLARAGDADREVAIALGRTLWSVRSRRALLRQRGDLPAVASPRQRERESAAG